MVVTKRNVDEVEQTLRFCRDRNLWIVFSTYLPAGRSGRADFDKSLVLSVEELSRMRETVKRVDTEYGFNPPIYNNFATFPCVEFMQVYGDGRVSPCPGNETIVGNIRTDSLKNLRARILKQFPCHDFAKFEGYCLYRPK
jgi:MoaA/NifB/PqqE/SkfB family radical SAM enzyme